jgi:hypothetical protein
LRSRLFSCWLSLSYLIFLCCQLPFCEFPKHTTALHYRYDTQMYCTFVLFVNQHFPGLPASGTHCISSIKDLVREETETRNYVLKHGKVSVCTDPYFRTFILVNIAMCADECTANGWRSEFQLKRHLTVAASVMAMVQPSLADELAEFLDKGDSAMPECLQFALGGQTRPLFILKCHSYLRGKSCMTLYVTFLWPLIRSKGNVQMVMALHTLAVKNCWRISIVNFRVIKRNSVASVRERNISTERPPLVGEVSSNFCG